MQGTLDINKEVAFFDGFAEDHGDYDVLGEGAYRRLVAAFRERVNPRPGESCIDLGCGTGAFTRRLSAFNLNLVGMDISPRSVSEAGARSTNERYITGDIRETKLPGGSFDIIVYSGVLHHSNERSGRVEMLREGCRLLRPGGRLFAYDPSAHSPSMFLYRDPRSPFFSNKGKTDNEVLLTRPGLESELTEAGFGGILVRGLSGITYRYVESRLARTILPLYNLYEQLMRLPPLQSHFGTFLVTSAIKPA